MAIVEKFAEILAEKGVRVFYDNWAEAELWGKDLYQHLDNVYRKAAHFCIIFLSKHYTNKAWTTHELRSAQARAFQENFEYILPVRIDDSELPGIFPTIGYIDLRLVPLEKLAQLVLAKLQHGEESKDKWPPLRTEVPRKFRIPRIPNLHFEPIQEAHNLVAHIEKVLDERIPVLKNAGLNVNKSIGDVGQRTYRVEYQARLVYFITMRVGSQLGEHVVSFLDGWSEPISSDAATAFAEVKQGIDQDLPRVSISNFSLLEDRGVSITLTYDELVDKIWDKACNIIESIVNRMS